MGAGQQAGSPAGMFLLSAVNCQGWRSVEEQGTSHSFCFFYCHKAKVPCLDISTTNLESESFRSFMGDFSVVISSFPLFGEQWLFFN